MIKYKKTFIGLLLFSGLIILNTHTMENEATQKANDPEQSGEESTNQLDIIQKLAEYKAIIDQYSTNLAVLKAENTQYAKENKKYEDTNFSLLADYEKAQIDIENLVNEKENTRQEIAKLNSKIENKKVKNRNLTKSLNNLQTNLENNQTTFKKLISEKNDLKRLTEDQLNNLYAKNKELEKNKIQIDQLTDQIEELQNKIQPNNSLENSTIQIGQLTDRIKELEEENKQIDNLKKELHSLKQEKILEESYANLMKMQEDKPQEIIRNNIENERYPIGDNDIAPIITSQINYEKASKGVRALGACVGGAIGGLTVFGLMAALKCMPQNPYINGGVITAGVATGAGIGCKLAGICYQKPRIVSKTKNGASVQICYNNETQKYTPIFKTSHE